MTNLKLIHLVGDWKDSWVESCKWSIVLWLDEVPTRPCLTLSWSRTLHAMWPTPLHMLHSVSLYLIPNGASTSFPSDRLPTWRDHFVLTTIGSLIMLWLVQNVPGVIWFVVIVEEFAWIASLNIVVRQAISSFAILYELSSFEVWEVIM